MRHALAILAALFVASPAAADSRSKPVDQKTFNALMNKLYPSGKGPSSTSRARGFYKGTGGQWHRR